MKPRLLKARDRAAARNEAISSKYRGASNAERECAQIAIDAIDALQWASDRLYCVRRLTWLVAQAVDECERDQRRLTAAEVRDIREAVIDCNDFMNEVE